MGELIVGQFSALGSLPSEAKQRQLRNIGTCCSETHSDWETSRRPDKGAKPEMGKEAEMKLFK
jgi:hypothetical protein